jgi:hypothetical protein
VLNILIGFLNVPKRSSYIKHLGSDLFLLKYIIILSDTQGIFIFKRYKLPGSCTLSIFIIMIRQRRDELL